MKRKNLLTALSLSAIALTAGALAGCDTGSGGGSTTEEPKYELKIETVYAMAEEAGFTGSLADLIALFKGEAGASAYQIATAGGYTGTEAEWLASLKGVAGASAYEIAKAGGYEGTEEEWITSLHGEDGVGVKSATVEEGKLIITLTNDSTIDCGSVVGEKGEQGENGLTPSIGEDGFWYLGETKLVSATGIQGEQGVSVSEIVLTGTNGLVDTYTITYSDQTTSTFTVTNAISIEKVEIKDGNLYVTLNDGKGEQNLGKVEGTDGKDGSQWITGTGAPTAETAGVNGDFYFDQDGAVIYQKKDGEWNEVLTLVINAEDGTVVQGPKGEDGKDGATWLTGAGVPSEADGKDGDLYLDTDEAKVYQKVAGAWQFLLTIKGEQGEQGEPGQNGQQGQQGENGENGEDGAAWLVGEGAPTASMGVDGDFYLDKTDAVIYQKIAGVWEYVLTIRGESGGEEGETPTVEKVTVTYSSGTDITYASVEVTKGEYLDELPTPTREGYVFLGWYLGEGVNAGQVTNVTPILRDMDLVARWAQEGTGENGGENEGGENETTPTLNISDYYQAQVNSAIEIKGNYTGEVTSVRKTLMIANSGEMLSFDYAIQSGILTEDSYLNVENGDIFGALVFTQSGNYTLQLNVTFANGSQAARLTFEIQGEGEGGGEENLPSTWADKFVFTLRPEAAEQFEGYYANFEPTGVAVFVDYGDMRFTEEAAVNNKLMRTETGIRYGGGYFNGIFCFVQEGSYTVTVQFTYENSNGESLTFDQHYYITVSTQTTQEPTLEMEEKEYFVSEGETAYFSGTYSGEEYEHLGYRLYYNGMEVGDSHEYLEDIVFDVYNGTEFSGEVTFKRYGNYEIEFVFSYGDYEVTKRIYVQVEQSEQNVAWEYTGGDAKIYVDEWLTLPFTSKNLVTEDMLDVRVDDCSLTKEVQSFEWGEGYYETVIDDATGQTTVNVIVRMSADYQYSSVDIRIDGEFSTSISVFKRFSGAPSVLGYTYKNEELEALEINVVEGEQINFAVLFHAPTEGRTYDLTVNGASLEWQESDGTLNWSDDEGYDTVSLWENQYFEADLIANVGVYNRFYSAGTYEVAVILSTDYGTCVANVIVNVSEAPTQLSVTAQSGEISAMNNGEDVEWMKFTVYDPYRFTNDAFGEVRMYVDDNFVGDYWGEGGEASVYFDATDPTVIYVEFGVRLWQEGTHTFKLEYVSADGQTLTLLKETTVTYLERLYWDYTEDSVYSNADSQIKFYANRPFIEGDAFEFTVQGNAITTESTDYAWGNAYYEVTAEQSGDREVGVVIIYLTLTDDSLSHINVETGTGAYNFTVQTVADIEVVRQNASLMLNAAIKAIDENYLTATDGNAGANGNVSADGTKVEGTTGAEVAEWQAKKQEFAEILSNLDSYSRQELYAIIPAVEDAFPTNESEGKSTEEFIAIRTEKLQVYSAQIEMGEYAVAMIVMANDPSGLDDSISSYYLGTAGSLLAIPEDYANAYNSFEQIVASYNNNLLFALTDLIMQGVTKEFAVETMGMLVDLLDAYPDFGIDVSAARAALEAYNAAVAEGVSENIANTYAAFAVEANAISEQYFSFMTSGGGEQAPAENEWTLVQDDKFIQGQESSVIFLPTNPDAVVMESLTVNGHEIWESAYYEGEDLVVRAETISWDGRDAIAFYVTPLTAEYVEICFNGVTVYASSVAQSGENGGAEGKDENTVSILEEPRFALNERGVLQVTFSQIPEDISVFVNGKQLGVGTEDGIDDFYYYWTDDASNTCTITVGYTPTEYGEIYIQINDWSAIYYLEGTVTEEGKVIVNADGTTVIG